MNSKLFSNIANVKSGDCCRIIGFKPGSMAYRNKLLSMGFTTGTVFLVKRVAPLGDPIEVEVRGYALSLRKKEAEILCIQQEGAS